LSFHSYWALIVEKWAIFHTSCGGFGLFCSVFMRLLHNVMIDGTMLPFNFDGLFIFLFYFVFPELGGLNCQFLWFSVTNQVLFC